MPSKIQINLNPLKELGLNDEQINFVLSSLGPLLQELIDAEIADSLNEAEEKMVQRVAGEDQLKSMVAYDEMYKAKTGNSLFDFTNQTLNELIVVSAKFMNHQKINLEKLTQLTKENLKQFEDFIKGEKYDQAQELLDKA